MRRHKKSKFDPYIKEIAIYLSMGMSTRQIAELIEYHFDDIVSESALYAFIRSRGLKSKVTQGGNNPNYDIPLCEKCDDCETIINTANNEVLLCVPAKRLINRSCKTSPMYCPKRPFDNEKKYELLQRR